jgi:hypothetical protein
MAITDNTAKWEVLSVTTPQTSSGNGLLPVGHVYITMGSTAPSGSLPLTGLLYSRSTYSDLWNYVNTHSEQLLSESAWQTKYLKNNGHVPYYSDGDGSTNFRVPTCLNLGRDTMTMDFVIDEGKDSYNWWRIWKSGWVEQGGRLDAYNAYTKKTIAFPKRFKNTLYHVEFTQSYDGNLSAATLATRNESSATFTNTRNTNGYASWYACGQGANTPHVTRPLWCVKAFGNIEETTGSTNVTNVVNNSTALNTKVDNFVAGTLNTHATAIAKMQSYFADQMTETKLFDVLGNSSGWTGDITFSDSWRNYDFLKIEFATTYDVSGVMCYTDYINTKKLQEEIQKSKDSGVTSYYFYVNTGVDGWYWNFNFNTSSETTWIRKSNSKVYPRRVWGYKLTATGITNKSAIDVSDMSEKIGGLLTTDNHLILPSGLEVW